MTCTYHKILVNVQIKLAGKDSSHHKTFYKIRIVGVHRIHMYMYMFCCFASSWLCTDFDIITSPPPPSPLISERKGSRGVSQNYWMWMVSAFRLDKLLYHLSRHINACCPKNSLYNSIFVNMLSEFAYFWLYRENTNSVLSKFITEPRPRRLYLVVTWR